MWNCYFTIVFKPVLSHVCRIVDFSICIALLEAIQLVAIEQYWLWGALGGGFY